MNIRQAVILAGGVGVRLRPLTYKMPKPMAPVNGRPFLEYLIDLLKENGIKEVLLLLGYMADKIVEHFGDGSRFGVDIRYSIGEVFFETGKRIKYAEDMLDDVFLLMYCDNYWPLRLDRLVEFHKKHGKLVTVTVYKNKDCITRNNIYVDEEGFVTKYDRSRTDENLNGVDIGFFIMNKDTLKLMPEHNFSFEKETIPLLIEKRELCGYMTEHRYHSISTLERLRITEEFLRPKKIIFLDRDGVINKKPPKSDYVKKWEEFEFLPGAIEALKLLTQHGYKIFIVTNQAGIARGMMTERDLKNIHENMKKELKKHGAEITAIYYCPHGWNDGCECRKPKPGMFFRAASDYDIDLTKAILVGDDERDMEAGNAIGCRTIKVTPENNLLQIVKTLIKEENIFQKGGAKG